MTTTADVRSGTTGRSASVTALRRVFMSMRWGSRPPIGEDQGGTRTVAFAAGLCVATVALVWLGYIATREWRSGTEQLRERRAAEALALSVAALSRDMKGAWASLIVPINQFTLQEDPPYDLLQQTAQIFAKFPYPESFIVWKTDKGTPRTFVFNRADRQPAWDRSPLSDDPFPVVLLRDPPELSPVIDAIRRAAGSGSPFIFVESRVSGAPYQVVAHLMFASTPPHSLSALAAFTINLQWVRTDYFGPLLSQVARIGGNEDSLSLAVTDEHGTLVAGSGAPTTPKVQDIARHFPLLFLDPAVLTPSNRRDSLVRQWTVHVRPSRDSAVDAALSGAYRILALIGVAAVASAIALLQTVRAVRASARLASMKSDFVSAVTHELKTPLALIRLVADTLAQGRYSSPHVIQDYARLLSRETARLGQSIDNLLTYARYTDPDAPRAPVLPMDIADLVEDAVERFRPTLLELGFELTMDVARDLRRVTVDGPAVTQAIEIVIDNAIKYSPEVRALAIRGRSTGSDTILTIADRGMGIPDEDIAHVFERFYRGRNAKESGSGLGLAIASRILAHHGGAIALRSTLGGGTEVDLVLPATS